MYYVQIHVSIIHFEFIECISRSYLIVLTFKMSLLKHEVAKVTSLSKFIH